MNQKSILMQNFYKKIQIPSQMLLLVRVGVFVGCEPFVDAVWRFVVWLPVVLGLVFTVVVMYDVPESQKVSQFQWFRDFMEFFVSQKYQYPYFNGSGSIIVYHMKYRSFIIIFQSLVNQ